MKTLPADHEVMHTLSFPTFSDAANDAGLSRRYGGIHFQSGDYAGRGWTGRSPSSSGGTAQNYLNRYAGKPCGGARSLPVL